MKPREDPSQVWTVKKELTMARIFCFTPNPLKGE